MRRTGPGSLLLALALALAAFLAPAAARRLAGVEFAAGGKPWQSKPVQTTKPLIGILAQVCQGAANEPCAMRAVASQGGRRAESSSAGTTGQQQSSAAPRVCMHVAMLPQTLLTCRNSPLTSRHAMPDAM